MKNLVKLKVILLVFSIIFTSPSFGSDRILPLPKPVVDQDRKAETAKKKEIYPKKKPEAEKVTVDYESPEEGIVLKILVNEGENAAVGKPIAIVGEKNENINDLLSSEISTVEEKPLADNDNISNSISKLAVSKSPDNISPSAIRIAKLRNVDLNTVSGTGPNGMIMRTDVLKAAALSVKSEDNESKHTPQEIIPLTGIRSTIASRLSAVQRDVPQVTLIRSVNVTSLYEYVKNNDSFQGSFNDVFVMVSGKTLEKHKNFNSWFINNEIQIFKDVNVGVAIDTSQGLNVVTIYNVNNLNLANLSSKIKELADKARNNKLDVEDVKNSTFTVTNLGMFGIEAFTPIINPPQVAILGIGKIIQKPWVINNDIKIQYIVDLSITFDHRAVDGADAARFLDTYIQYLTNIDWLK